MYGQMLKDLLDRKLTSVAEIEEVTGRGSSTVYRWLREESEPYASDIRRLVHSLRNIEARRALVAHLTVDLPIRVTWVEEDAALRASFEKSRERDGHDVVDMTLLALDTVSDLVVRERESIRTEPHLSRETYNGLVEMIETSVRYLNNTRLMLDKYVRDRKKARPLRH